MKLRIVSDLHFEFQADGGRHLAKEIATSGPDFDVLCVAGDIGTWTTVRKALRILCEAVGDKPVFFVAGNHEYYGGHFDTGGGHHAFAEAQAFNKNLQWLGPRISDIQNRRVGHHLGQRFIGCTLWFRHDGRRHPGLADFSEISGCAENVDTRAKVEALALSQLVGPNDVVLTHHLPHPNSISPRFTGSDFNRFFLHDVSPIVEHAGAKLWIHGHTHTSCDYVVGSTRVVCNPFGYAVVGDPHEPNPAFDPGFTVEI